jgi:thioredoxin 1
MTTVRDIDATTFDQAVLHADRPVLVEFWAQWCPPCHQLAPILDAIATERTDSLTVVKVNSDESPEIAAAYRVMALPTLVLLHGGEQVWSVVGARPKAKLLREIDEVLRDRRTSVRTGAAG